MPPPDPGRFTVAVRDRWLPGIYDSQQTALLAVDVADRQPARFEAMQQRVNDAAGREDDRVITLQDLGKVQ